MQLQFCLHVMLVGPYNGSGQNSFQQMHSALLTIEMQHWAKNIFQELLGVKRCLLNKLCFCYIYLDIYGLLLFLGVYPYCQQRWWKALLYEPYKNGQKQLLYNLLAKIMWRSAKNDVIDEVCQ